MFSRVAKPVRAKFPGVFISSEEVESPPNFPAASIEEIDNSVYGRAMTNHIENAIVSSFEVHVFSNSVGHRKQEAKEIMVAISDEFAKLGFKRTMCSPVKNLQDQRIYQIVARFFAHVDKEFFVYSN